jgi:hypothetical protein
MGRTRNQAADAGLPVAVLIEERGGWSARFFAIDAGVGITRVHVRHTHQTQVEVVDAV